MAELSSLREEKKKWDELQASQAASARETFEKELDANYADILAHVDEEPTEMFVTLVERGVDIPIAAKVVRETYSIATSPQEEKVAQPVGGKVPRAAGIASTGDGVGGTTPRRSLGSRPSLDDLIEASADSAFTSKSSRIGK